MPAIFTPAIIAFDADDTLWVNEPYYQETEVTFCHWMGDYASAQVISEQLYLTEMRNLELYGYGAKGYTLSMVETAVAVSHGAVSAGRIADIIRLGQSLLTRPVELLSGVEEVIPLLHQKFRLVLATKGDLLDQQRKLGRSGLEKWFHHIEIMTHKTDADYQRLIDYLKVKPSEFLMVGNSLKSDVLPVTAIGGHAIWIPYHTTWQHELSVPEHPHGYMELHNLSQLPSLLGL